MKKLMFTFLLIMGAGILLMSASQVNLQENEKEKSITQGKEVYAQNCMSCHQANGSGVPQLAPPLSKISYVIGEKPRLINILLNGFNEDVEIDGEYYGNPMPSFQALSDQQIADVLTYIRNDFKNNASMVKASEVKAERLKGE